MNSLSQVSFNFHINYKIENTAVQNTRNYHLTRIFILSVNYVMFQTKSLPITLIYPISSYDALFLCVISKNVNIS